MHSDRTNRSRIVVKATISEDLAGTEDHNVAKLQYLQKKNEKLNAMHIRSDIALPLRSRPRSHGLSQDIGHEGLSGTGLMESRQLSMDRQQPGNQHARRRQILQHLPPVLKERLAQMTPEKLAAFFAAPATFFTPALLCQRKGASHSLFMVPRQTRPSDQLHTRYRITICS